MIRASHLVDNLAEMESRYLTLFDALKEMDDKKRLQEVISQIEKVEAQRKRDANPNPNNNYSNNLQGYQPNTNYQNYYRYYQPE